MNFVVSNGVNLKLYNELKVLAGDKRSNHGNVPSLSLKASADGGKIS